MNKEISVDFKSKQAERVEHYLLDQLKPYKNNPRLHSEKQISQVVKSIDQFGFTNPILIDEDFTILAGHARYEAAKRLELRTVPVIVLNYLTKQQKQLYRIADNKLTENGKWDENLLGLEFKDLVIDLDIGELELSGFETTEIDLLIEGVSITQSSSSEDEIPPIDLDSKPVTKPGDIWLLGSHRIICGDSTDAETYKLLMGNEKAQMIFTDPPYNVKIDGNVGGLGAIKHREFAMASGEMTTEEFKNFLSKFIALNIQYSQAGSLHYICMDWRHIRDLLEVGLDQFTEMKNICTWVKDNGGMGSLYRSQHELIPVFKNGSESHINNVQLGSNGRYRTNVWNYAGVNSYGKNREDLKLHPTVKPVSLIIDAILDVTKRKQIVLDSFLGSGSTLIAANKVGRICYGIELDPIYIDTAIERFQKLIGLDAIHKTTSKTFNELKGNDL